MAYCSQGRGPATFLAVPMHAMHVMCPLFVAIACLQQVAVRDAKPVAHAGAGGITG